jgi:hypothetical protein
MPRRSKKCLRISLIFSEYLKPEESVRSSPCDTTLQPPPTLTYETANLVSSLTQNNRVGAKETLKVPPLQANNLSFSSCKQSLS